MRESVTPIDVWFRDRSSPEEDQVPNSEDARHPSPLVDPYNIGVGPMLAKEPLPRRWLIQDVLPQGVVGLLAAGGGTGKSYLTLQLAISVSTGLPFLGLEIGQPGGALIIAAEDEHQELHRRLWRLVGRMRADGYLDEATEELITERMFIASRVGQDNRLTAEVDRTILRTGTGDRIAALVDRLPGINLIVLDPVSRFRGGDENSNDAATRFVEAVEAVRAETGATIMMPHHVSKDGLRAGAEGLHVEGLRGASALVDGVRWAAVMASLRRDAARDYGIDAEEAGRYVRLDVVKNNYAPPWSGLWLERTAGGLLVPTELERTRKRRKEHKDEDRYREVLPKLKDLIRRHQEKSDPLTRNRLRSFAGADGELGVSDTTLRPIIERAIADGEISDSTRDKGRGKVLRTW